MEHDNIYAIDAGIPLYTINASRETLCVDIYINVDIGKNVDKDIR